MKKHKQFSISIFYKGMPIKIKITKKVISKKMRLKIDFKHNRVNVNIPSCICYNRGIKFVNEKLPWIYDILKNHIPINILQQKHIILLDKPFAINIIFNHKKSNINLIKNIITIHGNTNNEKKLNNLLKNFIKNLAKEYITEFIIKITNTLKINFNKIFVKDTISKWGSCSSLKNISINWRLIFAPKEVLNYIIYHEVAHLVYFNHGKNFWDLVKNLYPNYKDAQKWLKIHGNTLYRYKF